MKKIETSEKRKEDGIIETFEYKGFVIENCITSFLITKNGAIRGQEKTLAEAIADIDKMASINA